MRVLIATNMYPSPGQPARGAFVKAQVEAMLEMGISATVFEIHGRRSLWNYLSSVRPMRNAVRHFAADLVYAFYGLTGWVAQWQPRPVVLSLAGDDVLGTPNGRGGITLRSRAGQVASQWAAQRAAVVCVQSEEMKARLWGWRVRGEALVVPYGVDSKRFTPGDSKAVKQRLGIPVEEKTILFPNTPGEPRKRLDLAEAAVEIVRRVLPQAHLRVVSGVPHKDMPDFYRASDCLLLTSDWEGSPNVVKEALLSGLPVVTTDVGDVRSWIPFSAESAIVDRTASSVADGLLRVLRGSRRVDPDPFIAAFSSRVVAERMIGLFESILSSRAIHRGVVS